MSNQVISGYVDEDVVNRVEILAECELTGFDSKSPVVASLVDNVINAD